MTASKEEKIRLLEEKLQGMTSKSFSKTSAAYGGQGQNLEQFSMKDFNRATNKELMPCPRRPPGKKAAAAE